MWIFITEDGDVICNGVYGYWAANPKKYKYSNECIIIFQEAEIPKILEEISKRIKQKLIVKSIVPVDWE